MLWTIAIICLVLWAIGLITSFTLGGFIHLLILAAVTMLLVRIFKGPRENEYI